MPASPHDAFDREHPVYRQMLSDGIDALVDADPQGYAMRLERVFGGLCGVATMLVPGVTQTKQLPPEEVADKLCAQVWEDLEATVATHLENLESAKGDSP